MFNLPKSTELYQLLPKTRIFKNIELTSKDRTIIDNSISNIYLVNNISNKTISHIEIGNEIKSIWFLLVNLKRYDNINSVCDILYNYIPQKIILVLKSEGNLSISCYYDKLIISENIDEDYALSIKGVNLDIIYENFVIQIGDIVVANERTLKEQITENDRIESIKDQIRSLENKCKLEKQFNKKVEINNTINALKKELNVLNA